MHKKFFGFIFISLLMINLNAADSKQKAESVQNRAEWKKRYALLTVDQRVILFECLFDLVLMVPCWDSEKYEVSILSGFSWAKWEIMEKDSELVNLISYVKANQLKNIELTNVNSKEEFLSKVSELSGVQHLAYPYYEFVYEDLKKGNVLKVLVGKNFPSVNQLKQSSRSFVKIN